MPTSLIAGKTKVNLNGSIILSRYDVANFVINVDCADPLGLEVDYAFGALAIDGRVNGTVKVYGTPAFIQIDGDLESFDTSLTTAPAVVEESSGKTDVGVKLRIRSGPRVEFLYPNRALPILRSYIERNQIINVAIDTRTQYFEITGDVNLRGGDIVFLKRNFYIKEAVLTFNERNQEFDPIINGRAELKLPVNGINYKFSLFFDNNRLKNLNPRYTATPALSTVEIAAILAGTGLTQDQQNTQILYTVSDLGIRWGLNEIGLDLTFIHDIETSLRNVLGVDVLSVRTEIIPALVREAVAPLDNTSDSFGKYLDNTAILIGKYLGDDLYIELMGQLKAQDLFTENPSPLGVDIEIELSMEFSTPYFDLEWSFTPRNSEELFLRDHRFTFSWSLY
jgi:hypothetical protein